MSYIGNPINSVAFLTDQFSGNGSTVNFTMSVAPANTGSVLVAVSGVLQDPSTYAVNGTTLTFSAAPPSGTANVSVRYLGIPASGVTNTAYRTLTEFTATAGQTTFSVPSYTVNFVNVYRNGVMLGSADFTASSGTSIVLATGAAAGDLITTESFYVSSVLNAIPAVAGAVNTLYLNDQAVTPSKLAQPLTLGTVQNSTSGTAIDFTGIPSWAKRITLMFYNVSTNGLSNLQVQIGNGSIVSSGYASQSTNIQSTVSVMTSSSAFAIYAGNAANAMTGHFTLTKQDGNTWIASHVLATSPNNFAVVGSGVNGLGSALDRVRITTVNGTDAFDTGSINIMYEG